VEDYEIIAKIDEILKDEQEAQQKYLDFMNQVLPGRRYMGLYFRLRGNYRDERNHAEYLEIWKARIQTGKMVFKSGNLTLTT
jgi:hypothetical protein